MTDFSDTPTTPPEAAMKILQDNRRKRQEAAAAEADTQEVEVNETEDEPGSDDEQQHSDIEPDDESGGDVDGGEDSRIPKSRFDEVYGRYKHTSRELGEQREENAGLRKKLAQIEFDQAVANLENEANRPKNWEQMSEYQRQFWMTSEMNKIQRKFDQESSASPNGSEATARLTKIQKEGFTIDQAEAIDAIQQENPNLKFKEAVSLARMRDTKGKLFRGEEGSRRGVPPSHQQNRPGSTGSRRAVQTDLEKAHAMPARTDTEKGAKALAVLRAKRKKR